RVCRRRGSRRAARVPPRLLRRLRARPRREQCRSRFPRPSVGENKTPGMAVDPLNEEQREIRELVRTLARERVAPRAAEIDKSAEFPWDIVELLREHELFGLPFDEEYGGTGTGALMVLIAVEEIAKVCATTSLLVAVQELGSLGLKLAGTEEQKKRYLPRLATGEW